MSTDVEIPLQPDDVAGPPPPGRNLRRILVVVLAIAAVVAAAGLGYVWSDRNQPPRVPPTSVDAGFARDMSTHHQQAITMAGFVRDHSTNPSIRLLAFDIETQQYFQLGEMQGWLDSWGLSRSGNYQQMAWMGHTHAQLGPNGLMPGMATPDQMTRLQHLSGTQLDVYFLQLMLHHHQGGLPMAQYAAEHASLPYVRDLAQKMSTAQSNEIVTMEQMLRERNAAPLPAPN
jgi:uncharacterized protein (DUF305 family)